MYLRQNVSLDRRSDIATHLSWRNWMVWFSLVVVIGFTWLQQGHLISRQLSAPTTSQGTSSMGGSVVMPNTIIACCSGTVSCSPVAPKWRPPVTVSGTDCGNLPLDRAAGSNCPGGGYDRHPEPCEDYQCMNIADEVSYRAIRIKVSGGSTNLVITTCGWAPGPLTTNCPSQSENTECIQIGSAPGVLSGGANGVDLFLYKGSFMCEMSCQNLIAFDRVGPSGNNNCRSISVNVEAGEYYLVISEKTTVNGQRQNGSECDVAYKLQIMSDGQVTSECTEDQECSAPIIRECSNSISKLDSVTTSGISEGDLNGDRCAVRGQGRALYFDSYQVTVTQSSYWEFDLCDTASISPRGYFSLEIQQSGWTPEAAACTMTMRRETGSSSPIAVTTRRAIPCSNSDESQRYVNGRMRVHLNPGSYWINVIAYLYADSRPLASGEDLPYSLRVRYESASGFMSCNPYSWDRALTDTPIKTVERTANTAMPVLRCVTYNPIDLLDVTFPGTIALAQLGRITVDEFVNGLRSVDQIGDIGNIMACFTVTSRMGIKTKLDFATAPDGSYMVINRAYLSGHFGYLSADPNLPPGRPSGLINAKTLITIPGGTISTPQPIRIGGQIFYIMRRLPKIGLFFKYWEPPGRHFRCVNGFAPQKPLFVRPTYPGCSVIEWNDELAASLLGNGPVRMRHYGSNRYQMSVPYEISLLPPSVNVVQVHMSLADTCGDCWVSTFPGRSSWMEVGNFDIELDLSADYPSIYDNWWAQGSFGDMQNPIAQPSPVPPPP